MGEKHSPIGHHFIVEASGCNADVISDVGEVEKILVAAAERTGAKIWTSSFHKFNPHGVSGVVVISESHLSIHTWPEFGYAALDIYTCGDHVRPETGIEYAVESFGAASSHITELTRGIEEGDLAFYHSLVTWEEDHEAKD